MTPVNTQHSLVGQPYAVPLIQPDLRREEAIQQVADALQHLQNISGDIFSRISQRVELSRRQLQAIRERVSLAQAKIEKVKGSKKAIKVFSSAKYPAPERLREYGSIFTGALDPGLQRRPRYRIQSKHRPLDERALQEKLKYFPVCVNTKSEPEDEAEEGLGGLPSNISSISSLLLFNTTENLYGQEMAGRKRGGRPSLDSSGSLSLVWSSGLTGLVGLLRLGYPKDKVLPLVHGRGGQGPARPRDGQWPLDLSLLYRYKKYVFLDPLAGAVTKTHTMLGTEEEKLFDAPLSISKREQLEQQAPENYFYVPDLGQVPEIDVPSYLPDLPGIADDLMYSADLGPGIAPSAPGAIPELPAFHTEVAEPFQPGLEEGVLLAAPPPPPPPPPPPLAPTVLVSASQPPMLPEVATAPSQAAREEDTSSSAAHSASVQGAPREVVDPSSGRATLLESIRQAGGIGKAKLRSVKERKLEKKKQKEQEQVRATSQGGDLMSDLFNKLVLRRKGISGKGPGTSEGPGGAFTRMSDSIPPLPPPQQPAGDEDEDDWES